MTGDLSSDLWLADIRGTISREEFPAIVKEAAVPLRGILQGSFKGVSMIEGLLRRP